MRTRKFSFVIAVLLLTIFVTTVQGAGPTGAIFTTTPDGGIVNENTHYDYKIEVYLDGGPGYHAPKQAAGLDDGLYVFQVTDPSGGVLLSMDPSKCRVIEVKDGVIDRLVLPTELGETAFYKTAAKDKDETIPCHVADSPEGAAGVSGHHDTNIDTEKDGLDVERGIVVQLMPFLDTPNPGGVYKAWVSKYQTYLDRGGDLSLVPGLDTGTVKKKGVFQGYTPDPGFGPPRSDQKTDNFKVKEVPPYIKVVKYEDVNGNGMLDVPPDVMIEGWKVWIYEDIDNNGIFDSNDVVSSCLTPCWKAVAPGVLVKVVEELPLDWVHSYLYVDGTAKVITSQPTDAYVKFEYGDIMHKVVFGNYKLIPKSGYKWHDMDADGVWDAGEVGLKDWTIKISGTNGKGEAVVDTEVTDADGFYQFKVPPGTYKVEEICPTDVKWYQSYPAALADECGKGVYANLVFKSGDVDEGNNFGNYQYATKSGYKWHDLNADGIWQKPGEPGLAGWTIHLSGYDGKGRLVQMSTTTGAGGYYEFKVPPGTYKVEEVCPEKWYQSFPATAGACGTGVYNITLTSGQVDSDNNFGNYQYAKKGGYKFHDLNADGLWQPPDEPGLEGWKITITDGVVSKDTLTDATGYYEFSVPPGTYTVSETCPAGWYQSFPAPTGACGTGVHQVTLISQQKDLDNNFGNYMPVKIEAYKFFDKNTNGVKDDGEPFLPGFEFCAYDEGLNLISADDFVTGATVIPACQTTGADGYVAWMGLMPGTYTVKETPKTGWFPTGPMEYTFKLYSGTTKTLWFGNVTNCVGLTPGYWSNWRNHYTAEQFEILLEGTIASSITEADLFLTSTGCEEGNEVPCLRRFVLANQLTLNLTQHPELPNPSGGNLYPVCQLIGCDGAFIEGNLGEWLAKALDILAHPEMYTRDQILWVKDILDKFANMKYIYWP